MKCVFVNVWHQNTYQGRGILVDHCSVVAQNVNVPLIMHKMALTTAYGYIHHIKNVSKTYEYDVPQYNLIIIYICYLYGTRAYSWWF